MTTYDACAIIEGFDGCGDAPEHEVTAAVQHLIDTGDAWRLQGSYGRMAMDYLNAGLCTRPARKE